MAGAEDHDIPVHQLPDQIATLTQVRSLTARLFTRAEQAQNHVQVGNFGLAFRVILDWMASLGTIEGPAAFGNQTALYEPDYEYALQFKFGIERFCSDLTSRSRYFCHLTNAPQKLGTLHVKESFRASQESIRTFDARRAPSRGSG